MKTNKTKALLICDGSNFRKAYKVTEVLKNVCF